MTLCGVHDFYRRRNKGPEKLSNIHKKTRLLICRTRNLWYSFEVIAKRKIVYERYYERFKDIQGLKISGIQDNVEFNYAYFPIVFNKELFGKSRDEVKKQLEKENIFTRKYFYPLTSENKGFMCVQTQETPNAFYCSRNVLCLPMYADLPLDIVDKICKIII